MVVNGRPLKRAKKRVTADLYDFLTFPAGAEAGAFEGPFRANVRAFLSRHARLPPPSSVLSPTAAPHLLAWRVSFRIGGPKRDEEEEEVPGRKAVEEDDEAAPPPPAHVVDLDVVEEDVARSRSVYCDQCRVVGWSGHPVCGKRYHFIIRNDSSGASYSNQTCTRCGTLLQFSDTRCTTCNYEMSPDDLEDWAYLQLGDSTHLLHGVVHTNGYGHLLRINGREGGSKFLTGCVVMDFWDRLCKMLRVRTLAGIWKSYTAVCRMSIVEDASFRNECPMQPDKAVQTPGSAVLFHKSHPKGLEDHDLYNWHLFSNAKDKTSWAIWEIPQKRCSKTRPSFMEL